MAPNPPPNASNRLGDAIGGGKDAFLPFGFGSGSNARLLPFPVAFGAGTEELRGKSD